jgi:hypothetical protein
MDVDGEGGGREVVEPHPAAAYPPAKPAADTPTRSDPKTRRKVSIAASA